MNNNIITCSEAREVSLFHFLKQNGVNPVKLNDKEAWYISPLRDERTASFKVCLTKNIWYDFGASVGGSIIDFVIYTQNCDISHALYVISNTQQYIHQPKTKVSNEVDKGGFEILRKREIHINALSRYILNRSIDLEIAKKYCKEITYGFRNKIFFAIGFESDSNGIELRSLYFKGSYSKKNYTLIKNNSETIIVFEGFFDFLSHLTIFGDNQEHDYLVLNSVALVDKSLIVLSNYQKINLYLDNDNAGDKATEKIKTLFPKALDNRLLYKDYGDLNEYLIDITKPM